MNAAQAKSSSTARLAGWALLVLLAAAAPRGAARAQDDKREEPPYPHGSFSEDCSICHREDRWVPARITGEFKHTSAFPLAGAHAKTSCGACHVTLEFQRVSKTCVDCHQDVHRGEFGTDCSRCHTTFNFIDRSRMMRAHRTTRFPLTGAHAVGDCDACHRLVPQGQLTYVGLSTECEACHTSTRFPTAPQRPPEHLQAGYTDACDRCHSTISFTDTRIDHAAVGFPLTGAHGALDCTDCHGTPFNPSLSQECVSCHRDDYDATTTPNHVQAGFPTDCKLCHTTVAFTPANFDHQSTAFPLTGAHVGLDCASCHSDGVYDGKPTNCYSCHRSDYEQTTDPAHVAAGFSQDCTRCHTTTTFSGARYTDHDAAYFPIYSGRHAGRWNSCSDCHTTSNNYSAFSCFLCHSQADTDPRHQGEPGYSYDSQKCYQCHPRGEAD